MIHILCSLCWGVTRGVRIPQPKILGFFWFSLWSLQMFKTYKDVTSDSLTLPSFSSSIPSMSLTLNPWLFRVDVCINQHGHFLWTKYRGRIEVYRQKNMHVLLLRNMHAFLNMVFSQEHVHVPENVHALTQERMRVPKNSKFASVCGI
jgi:hypothetical protein